MVIACGLEPQTTTRVQKAPVALSNERRRAKARDNAEGMIAGRSDAAKAAVAMIPGLK